MNTLAGQEHCLQERQGFGRISVHFSCGKKSSNFKRKGKKQTTRGEKRKKYGGVGETTFHYRYNSCHLMVKNEMRTTKLAMLITDTSSEVVTVNFINHL